MTKLTFSQIENAQFPYRLYRQPIQIKILEFLLTSGQIAEPFWAINRMFVRLKSADSIVEKINRKKLSVETIEDLQRLVTDVLGFRVITENLIELEAVDDFIRDKFGVVKRNDTVQQPNEFGYQSIEYALHYHDPQTGESVPFELQLRTILQHQWSAKSFHLFHKKPLEVAQPYRDTLQSLSRTLVEVEKLSDRVAESKSFSVDVNRSEILDFGNLPIQAFINLMVINPGEVFVDHVRIPVSENAQTDHYNIVEEKMRLYQIYPEAAVVECNFMDVTAYALNESHVIFMPKYLEKIQW